MCWRPSKPKTTAQRTHPLDPHSQHHARAQNKGRRAPASSEAVGQRRHAVQLRLSANPSRIGGKPGTCRGRSLPPPLRTGFSRRHRSPCPVSRRSPRRRSPSRRCEGRRRSPTVTQLLKPPPSAVQPIKVRPPYLPFPSPEFSPRLHVVILRGTIGWGC